MRDGHAAASDKIDDNDDDHHKVEVRDGHDTAADDESIYKIFMMTISTRWRFEMVMILLLMMKVFTKYS